MKTFDIPEVSNMRVEDCHDKKYWEFAVESANFMRKGLNYKPEKYKIGYQLSPSGILNAYREGDLNFEEACKKIEYLINKR